MSTTWTPDVALPKPAHGDPDWHVPLWALSDALEASAPLAGLQVTLPLAERAPNDGTPPVSTSLNVRVAPGTYRLAGVGLVDFPGAPAVACPPSAVGYVYLAHGAPPVAQVAAAWPPSGPAFVPLAVVTAVADHITAIDDARVACGAAEPAGRWSVFGRPPVARQGPLTANNAGVLNSGDATTDAVVAALRQRLLDLEAALVAYGLLQ